MLNQIETNGTGAIRVRTSQVWYMIQISFDYISAYLNLSKVSIFEPRQGQGECVWLLNLVVCTCVGGMIHFKGKIHIPISHVCNFWLLLVPNWMLKLQRQTSVLLKLLSFNRYRTVQNVAAQAVRLGYAEYDTQFVRVWLVPAIFWTKFTVLSPHQITLFFRLHTAWWIPTN